MSDPMPEPQAGLVADVDADSSPVARPSVARQPGRDRGRWGYLCAVAAGGAVLVAMTASRHALHDDALIPAASAATIHFTDPQPLPADTASPGSTGASAGTPAIAAPQFTTSNQLAEAMPAPAIPLIATPAAGMSAAGAPSVPGAGRGGPAMIVDLSDAQAAAAAGRGDALLANPALAAAKGAPAPAEAGDAQFLQRVAGPSEAAQATRIGKPDSIVAEGTTISATLETSINSDLPGYARAVIARDVMSFDGLRMLIPRGSRVIGQYKANVAAGTSRVFVVWTRLIRPDGVTIQLASPSTDDLGRGGLTGKVQRHFLERFGGPLLTSLVNGGLNLGAAALGGGTPLFVNSVAESGAAAAPTRNGPISPTVQTPQGSAIKIFVARDLDFSGVE